MHTRYLAIAVVGILSVCGLAAAEEATQSAFEPYIGEVMTETLNVRSGPSTNYYVVTRIHRGGHVRVVGEESGWLAVVPPKGCFSLIAAEYVDRGDGVSGVVNGDKVRVRAGSDLSPHNYAVQVKLNRGALVKVLGEADEQYLKIEPPAKTTLWVSDEFIRRAPGGATKAELAVAESFDNAPGYDTATPASETATDSKPAEVETKSGSAVADAKPEPKPKPKPKTEEPAIEVTTVSAEEYRHKLEVTDAKLKDEMARPLMHRDFSVLLPAYRELVDQKVDEYVRAYAEVRIKQLEDADDMIASLRNVRQLREDIRTVRKTALAERANLRPPPVEVGGGFDAEGELWPSALYDSPVGPRRYRLVDPTATPPRTLGYVEIPPESSINANDYLGRRVGVRAREHILQTGNVNPIAIYVAAELVVLDRLADAPQETATAAEESATASKQP